MKSPSKRVTKADILAVLEDGVQRSAREVHAALQARGLKTTLNSVQKHMQRCVQRQLVQRVEGESCYRYLIAENGVRRLHHTRAKRHGKRVERTRPPVDYKERAFALETRIMVARLALKHAGPHEKTWIEPYIDLLTLDLDRLKPHLDLATHTHLETLLDQPNAEESPPVIAEESPPTDPYRTLLVYLLMHRLHDAEAVALSLWRQLNEKESGRLYTDAEVAAIVKLALSTGRTLQAIEDAALFVTRERQADD